jgi:hypothetical protein
MGRNAITALFAVFGLLLIGACGSDDEKDSTRRTWRTGLQQDRRVSGPAVHAEPRQLQRVDETDRGVRFGHPLRPARQLYLKRESGRLLPGEKLW